MFEIGAVKFDFNERKEIFVNGKRISFRNFLALSLLLITVDIVGTNIKNSVERKISGFSIFE